ncbi:MAG: DNA cytosine methyltransferase, partial [Polyangiaceae bacterium]
MTNPATVIELFSGCGGMSCGLAMAGFNVVLGADHNAAAIDSFNYNHGHLGARGIVADVRKVDGPGLRDAAGLGRRRLDLLVGGPPCQPFSIIGKRLAFEDERGDLVLEFVRLLKELEPEAFIFENVANFGRIQEGEVARTVIARMQKAGYAVSSGVLDAPEYGIAQMRKRFFIVGTRGKRAPGLPKATHGPFALLGQKPIRACREVLDDLPDVDTEDSLRVRNHDGTTHSPTMLKMFAHLMPGERDPKSHHDRLDPDRPAYTIRAGNGNFTPLRPIHY